MALRDDVYDLLLGHETVDSGTAADAVLALLPEHRDELKARIDRPVCPTCHGMRGAATSDGWVACAACDASGVEPGRWAWVAPDESVRRDSEMRSALNGAVYRARWGPGGPDFVGLAHNLSELVRLVPVSDAEPARVPADCPHDTFESDGGHELRRCVRCGLGGGAEREPSGEDHRHG